jgi:hypothetical protein
MKEIFLVENSCCGSVFQDLGSYLANRFDYDSNIKIINLNHGHAEVIDFPKSVAEKVTQLGDSILPAIFVNNTLVSSGYVPNIMEAVKLITEGRPSESSIRSGGQSGGFC